MRINKLLIFLLVGVFLISLTSAMDWDNLKQPMGNGPQNYPNLRIVNAFGFGEILFEGSITKHTKVCENDCLSTMDINHSGGVLISNIYFKTLQEDGSWIEQDVRSYSLKYEAELPEYETECIDGEEDTNGTIEQICTTIQTGTYGGYKTYTIGEELPEGNYELTLNAKKSPSRTVDWVIETHGEELLEWATWGNISLGDDAEVILNSPANASILLTNEVKFNCSANVTGGATLINMSLFTNQSGTWGIKNTTELLTIDSLDVGTTNDQTGGTTDGLGGYKINVTEELFIDSFIQFSGNDQSDGWVCDDKSCTTVYYHSSCVGLTCDFDSLSNLSSGIYYFLINGTDSNRKQDTSSVSYPDSGNGYDVLSRVSPADGTEGTDWYIDIEVISTGKRPIFSTQTWNRTISDTTLWSCQSCDSDGDCGFAEENRTLFLDSTPPTVEVQSPNGTLDYGVVGLNETLNVTFTDSSLESCWYNYNGTNVTITGCQSGIKNSTEFILEIDNLNMTLYANDTTGNENATFINWDYRVLEINQTFNNNTLEGATEQFTINFIKSLGIQVSTVSLIYNGTVNSFPYSVSGNSVISQSSITIPVVVSNVNVSFYWNITFSDGNSIITRSNNQTIASVNVDDCSSFTNIIYNFTQYDEENQTMLSGNNTIELQINLYDTSKTTLLTNFSNRFVGVNPVQFCAENPILETVNYSSYVIVKYFANSTSASEKYSVEYYNILNQTISNSTIPINIPLYNLKVDDTTKFRLIFRDDEYVLAPGILVQVHRQYIKDNDFKIVEIPITDSDGQTILNLVKDTIIYNLIMSNEAGEIVGVFNSIAAFCSDFSIGDCSINLAPDPVSDDVYDYNEEFDISLSDPSYDNFTQRISMSFVTGDLTATNVRMDIVRNNNFGNRSVCSDSLFAASGILSCDVSAITDTDQFLFISTYVEDNLAKEDTTNLNSDILNFGTLNGAFYAFFFILILISIFMEDRKILVISLGLGWLGVISLGLINGKFIGFTSAGIWILITIAIFLWKLNEEEKL